MPAQRGCRHGVLPACWVSDWMDDLPLTHRLDSCRFEEPDCKMGKHCHKLLEFCCLTAKASCKLHNIAFLVSSHPGPPPPSAPGTRNPEPNPGPGTREPGQPGLGSPGTGSDSRLTTKTATKQETTATATRPAAAATTTITIPGPARPGTGAGNPGPGTRDRDGKEPATRVNQGPGPP